MLGVVFVHGFNSSPKMWDAFSGLMAGDGQFAGVVAEVRPRFGYATGLYSKRLTRAIPTLDTAAYSLKAYLGDEAPPERFERLMLVGHSMGGLVIQRYLAQMLGEGRGRELARIRHVMLLATPNAGSLLLRDARRVLLGGNPQEQQLRPLNTEVADTLRTMLRDVVNAPAEPTERTCRIDFSVYAGESDKVVPPGSALAGFPDPLALPGDHFSIARPTSREHRSYSTLKRRLLAAADGTPPAESASTLWPAAPKAHGTPTSHGLGSASAADTSEPGQAVSWRRPWPRRWLAAGGLGVAAVVAVSVWYVVTPESTPHPPPSGKSPISGQWFSVTPQNMNTVIAVAVSADGAFLAAGGEAEGGGGAVAAWMLNGQAAPIPLMRNDQAESVSKSPVEALAISAQKILAVGVEDGTVYLWQLSSPSGPQLLGSVSGGVGRVNALSFTVDGKTLAVGGNQGLQAMSADPGHFGSDETRLSTADVQTVAYDPAGNMLAAGTATGQLLLWDPTPLPASLPSPTYFDKPPAGINALSFSNNGKDIAVGSTARLIPQNEQRGMTRGLLLVNAVNPRDVREYANEENTQLPVGAVSVVSAADSIIASASTAGAGLAIYSTDNLQNMRCIAHSAGAVINAIVTIPRTSLFITGAADGIVTGWDAKTAATTAC